jgi:hypothetical protein
MQNLEQLKTLAGNLTGGLKENAENLVERMGEVIEGIGDKPIEWRPGMLKLVQGTSDRSKLPKGTGIGDFVLGEEKVETPFKVIPLMAWTSRQMWDPNPDNAKMVCNSPDGTVGWAFGDCKVCPNGKFDQEANKSACNKQITVLVVSADLKEVFTVNFAKTNYMNGVDWQGLMKKAGVAPYKRLYNLSSQTSTKNKNVELIKAEPVTGEKVEGEVLAFVEELFRRSNTDRKEMLVKFHEYVKTKKTAAPALEAAPDVQLIAHDEATVDVAAVEVATSEAPEAKAKTPKYKM